MRIKVRARKTHKGTFQQDAGDTVGHHRHRLSVISSASNVEIGVIIINVVCVCVRALFLRFLFVPHRLDHQVSASQSNVI